MGSWSEQYVDTQVDRAWLELRMDLADRFAAGLAEGEMEPIDFVAESGEVLTAYLDDDRILIVSEDEVLTSDNVDEAAYLVFEALHGRWQVVHPVFLDSGVVERPSIDDNPLGEVAPAIGRAASKEQLQAWVVATFNDGRTTPVRVGVNGDVNWRTRGGGRVTVRVHNAGRIELISVLGHEVSFKKARKVVNDLSWRYFGLKFFLLRDSLVMSQILVAYPFVGDQLNHALSTFMRNVDELGWVEDKVMSKRVKQRRALEVPPALVAMLATVPDLQRADLVQAVTSRAGSRRTLEAWRVVAHREWRKARRLAEGDEDPLKLNARVAVSWWRLRRAIDISLQAQGNAEEAA